MAGSSRFMDAFHALGYTFRRGSFALDPFLNAAASRHLSKSEV